jgi:hypothetical protein
MIVVLGIEYLEYIPESELNILQCEHEMNNEIESNKALNGNRTINQIIIEQYITGNRQLLTRKR